MSKFYKVSVDLLITVDVRKYPLDKILALPDKRIVLPVTVDSKGDNKIEIILHKTSMGYLTSYSDPEYIESLQTISLPFLRNGTFRAFPDEGDSMPPYTDGTYIVGKYVESLDDLKIGKCYLFITKKGMTYKSFQNSSAKIINVITDNELYEPFTISRSEIIEVWEFACSINTEELTNLKKDEFTAKDVYTFLKKEIEELKSSLNR